MMTRIQLSRIGAPVLIAGMLAMGACEAAPELVGPPDTAGFTTLPAPTDPGQQLARSLALALRDTRVRASLRYAFRDSRKTEHKLVLQEFVETPKGGALLHSAAAAAGVEVETVRGWIAALPPLDFYVPVREHRRSWAGSDNIVVGFNIHPNETKLTGYKPDGSVIQLDRRDGIPAEIVLLVHTAEPKQDRADAGRSPRGETIEPVSPLADIGGDPCMSETAIAPCTGVGGPSGGGGGSGPRLYIRSFYPQVGDGWGDLELHFKQYDGYYDANTGQIVDTKIWEWITSGANENQWKTVNQGTGGGNLVRVWERDSDWEPTDHDQWGYNWVLPYGSTDPAYQSFDNSFVTNVIGNCYEIHEDWYPQAYCYSPYQELVSIRIDYQYR